MLAPDDGSASGELTPVFILMDVPAAPSFTMHSVMESLISTYSDVSLTIADIFPLFCLRESIILSTFADVGRGLSLRPFFCAYTDRLAVPVVDVSLSVSTYILHFATVLTGV